MPATDVIISPWDNPRNVEILCTMHAEGATASEISLALGQGISRNAVIGKTIRLKLPPKGRKKTVSVERSEQHGNKGQPKAKSIISRAESRDRAAAIADHQHATNSHFRPGFLPPEDDGVDVTALVGLVDLKRDSCRWPFGDPLEPDFGFCGKTAKEGSPYCPAHHARAFKSAGTE